VDRLVSTRVTRIFDEALTAKARVLMTLMKLWPAGVELDFADEFMPEFTDPADPAYFQVQLEGDRLVELSESFLFEGVREGARLQVLELPADQPRLSDVDLPDGRRGRQVQVDFLPQLADALEEDEAGMEAVAGHAEAWRRDEGLLGGASGGRGGRPLVTIAVAVHRGPLESRLLVARLTLAGTSGALLASLALIAALALRVGLRPVERLAAEVEALDERRLDDRFETGSLPRELRPMAEQLNGLLDRIERVLQRERQLTSDIAHDLKTPVAELRALCDVGGRWPEDPETVARFFADARDVARTLERTIDRLLSLARHDAGRETARASEFDLVELVSLTASAFRSDAEARELEVRLVLPDQAWLRADRDKVAAIVGNLLENAVEHAVAGTPITCELRAAVGRDIVLRMENEAEHLDPEDVSKVFERFWRKDSARGERSHAGLGLALARADADLIGACLDAEIVDSGLAVTFTVPAGLSTSPPVVTIAG
jgi:two-component system sensor histidine kinase QseC